MGGEEREEREGKGKGLKEGEGCVIAFGGWTPLLPLIVFKS
jgi:hypothetical protein